MGWTLLGIVVAVVLLGVIRIARQIRDDDPALWQRDIKKFEIDDARAPVEAGRIVFIGSSTIRRWRTLTVDMSPLPVLNRGFGGARIHDLIHYASSLATRHRPRALVVYAGENDIAGGFTAIPKSALVVRERFEKFCSTIFAALPKVPIYFVSIKPPKRRMARWPQMQEANRLIREYCDGDARLHFIDITQAMMDERHHVREELFSWDGIHLNRRGYEVLTVVIKSHLLALPCPRVTDAVPVSPT